MNCDIDETTLRCTRCNARVSRVGVLRNCGAAPRPEINTRLSIETVLPIPPGHEPPPSHGPGTELKKLLGRIGIKASPTCTCNARAREMDAWGVEESAKPERVEQAVGWLREEASKRGLPFLDAAGRVLVRRAIHNARKAEAARAQEAQQKGPPAV